MWKRSLRRWWIALLPLMVGTAHAGMLEDAKGALTSIGSLGDHGLATATSTIDNIRSACMASMNGAALSVGRLEELRAENAALASSLPAGSLPPELSTSGALDAAKQGMNSAMSAWNTAVQVTSIPGDVASALRTRAGTAKDKLRDLFPSPLGTRSLTRAARCKDPVLGIEVDCQVPNTPSDDEIRSAISEASSVLSDVGMIGVTAMRRFYRGVDKAQGDWMARYLSYADLLSRQRLLIDQARFRTVHPPVDLSHPIPMQKKEVPRVTR